MLTKLISETTQPYGIFLLLVTFIFANYFGVSTSNTLVIIFAIHKIVAPLKTLTHTHNLLNNLVPSFDFIESINQSSQLSPQISGDVPFITFNHAIKLQNVTFHYPNHEPVISNLSIIIPKNKMIALVGSSGSGKSTIADIVVGFNDPQSGSVLIDEIPLKTYSIDSYRNKISYVLQDSQLFNMSIRDNLIWAYNSATEDDIINALKLSNSYEFANALPQKLDTIIGERGMRLSGGQCQRLALARSIIRRPELLILDEATSALDSESEQKIQQSIETLADQTTLLVIAHRLSTIKKADYIYVIDDTKVVEEGTYQSLISKNKVFNKMLELQYDIR